MSFCKRILTRWFQVGSLTTILVQLLLQILPFGSAGAGMSFNLDFLVHVKNAGLTANIHMSSSLCFYYSE